MSRGIPRRSAKAFGVYLVGALSLVTAWIVGGLALGQSQARRAHPAAKPAPTASDDETSTTANPATASPSSPDGGIVPSDDYQSSDGGKLSPLTPTPDEFSDAGAPAMTVDYDRLLTEIAALRARVAAVSDTLFHSRITLSVETKGDHARVATFDVSLDDGIVWTSSPGFHADDPVTVYEHSVAPGRHAVSVDIERRDDRDGTFRSVERSRFVVDVPNEQRLVVSLKLSDESNIGGDFSSDKKGEYDLRIVARAQARPVAR